MKKIKFAIVAIFIAILIHLPILVLATHGFGSGVFTVMVDDNIFELWGFDGDGPVPAFRLEDMAYMFNGTSAQFDIRTPPDDRWDFWIVRGTPYTPQGTELSLEFENRNASFGSYGFVGGYGFDSDPVGAVIVGIDGHNEPATTIALTVIKDPGGIFFEVSSLVPLLGIAWDWSDVNSAWPYADMLLTTGTAVPVQPPIQAPELVDILLRVGGHWVDYAHFYSPVIDESVVWPAAFMISTGGFTDINVSLAPIRPWQGHPWRYPVSMRDLEFGYVELTVDITGQPILSPNFRLNEDDVPPDDIARFYNHRIVFDASQERIEEVMYYIGDMQFNMVRNDWRVRHAERYTVEPAADGGIALRYVFWSISSLFIDDREFRIYRSTEMDERGELILRRQSLDTYDPILFEFVDTTVEYGQVYYYTFYTVSERWGHSRVFIPGARQLVVDVNEVLGLPPGFTGAEVEDTEIPEPEVEIYEAEGPEVVETLVVIEPDTTEEPHTFARLWIWISVLLVAIIFVVLCIVYKKAHPPARM